MIQPSEARELCSDSQWKLVETSFPPAVETLPQSDLESRIGRVIKLQLKSTDMIYRQHSDARQRKTRRKAQLFGEVAGRFQVRLELAIETRSPPAADSRVPSSGSPEVSI